MIPTPTTSAARTVCAGGLALTLLLAGCGGGDPQASAAALAASAAVDLADQESAQAAALAAVNDIERALRLHAWRDTAEAAGALLDSPLAAHLDGDAHWSARRAQLIALGMQGDVEQLERDWSAAVDEQVDAGRLAAAAGTICGLRGGDDAGDSALLVWLLSRVGTAHDAFLAGTIVPPEEIGKVDAWRARTAEAARRAALPESHADAFPRAWLAPIAPPADAR